MIFTIPRRDLLKAVTACAAVSDPKASQPALACVKIDARLGDHAIAITGSDTFTSVVSTLAAKVERPGATIVDAKTFRDIVNSLPEADVHIEITDGAQMRIRANKDRRTIGTMYEDDYPMLAKEPANFVRMTGPALLRAITLVEHAMCCDETRPYMAGLKLDCEDGKIVACTTDGHRISHTEIACETGAFTCVLPFKSVSAAKRALTEAGSIDIEIGTDGSHACLRCAGVTTLMRLSDGVFPPTSKILAMKLPKKFTASRELLLRAVRSVNVTAKQEGKDKADAVVMTISDGEVRFDSRNQKGDSTSPVDCDYAGPNAVLGFQPSYLSDPLSAMCADDVSIEFGGEFDAVKIVPATTNETTCLVMPMRVN